MMMRRLLSSNDSIFMRSSGLGLSSTFIRFLRSNHLLTLIADHVVQARWKGETLKQPKADKKEYDEINYVLEETLEAVGAKAMVVGHTSQFDGVNCKYNCSILRIDVGMSSGDLNSRLEVLEINDNNARVLRSKSDTFTEL